MTEARITRLLADQGLGDITARVNDGSVTLTGTSGRIGSALAEQLAESVDGVTKIENRINEPRFAVAVTPAQRTAVTIAREFAADLASGRWDEVRLTEPDVASLSNAQLEAGYGMLQRSEVVPIEAWGTTGSIDLRLLLVAHEIVGGREETNPFCVTWRIDTRRATVQQTGLDSIRLFEPVSTPREWVDLQSAVRRWSDVCVSTSASRPAPRSDLEAVDGPGTDPVCEAAYGNSHPYFHEDTGLCYANPVGQ